MAEEFPLPSSSCKELIKIIRAYGRIGTEASLGDVSKLAVMGETSVSGNNKFLIALGIIKAGQKKAITPLGDELAKALDHEMPDEIAAKWRAVVNATDFLERVIAAVRIRKTMDEASLESHVAYSAGQPKTPAVATGARTVVDRGWPALDSETRDRVNRPPFGLCQGTAFSRAIKRRREAPSLLPQAVGGGAQRPQPTRPLPLLSFLPRGSGTLPRPNTASFRFDRLSTGARRVGASPPSRAAHEQPNRPPSPKPTPVPFLSSFHHLPKVT